MIFASDLGSAIGQSTRENGLPWENIPEDFKSFQTISKACGRVLMGGNTWRTIFKMLGKALPGRENIVISRTITEPPFPGVLVFNSFESAMKYLSDKDVICIGGAQIYDLFVPYADEIFFTKVHALHDQADCFIRKEIFDEFKEVGPETVLLEDSISQIKATLHYYQRNG